MSHTDFIGPDGDKWPSATDLTNLIPQPWVWAWYKNQVRAFGWRGWQKCLAQSERGKRIGTQVHDLLEKFINKQDVPYNPKDKYNAQQYADALYDAVNSEVSYYIECEQHVIAPELKLHGTVDLIVRRKTDGDLWVGDWKTASGKSETHPIQLAVYAMCLNEMYQDQKINKGFIARVDKKSKGLNVKIDNYENLQQYFPVVMALREIYDYINNLGAYKKK